MTTPAPSQLETGAVLERVATGATWAEGPLWIPPRRAVRFSDIPGNRILEFSEATGELSVFAEDVEFTNGRTLDLDGTVIECSHGRRAVQRDTAVEPGAVHSPQTLVDRFGAVRLNSPNDVIVAADGAIWFTDPSYGIRKPAEGHAGEEEYGDRYVFRVDPASGEVRPVVIDVEAPNGLALSPDESLLYVADSSLSPADEALSAGRPRGHAIHVYDVVDGRHAKNGRVLVEIEPGLPDGIRVDVEGRIWSSSGSGVQVFSPAGERLAEIPVPELTANLCFGGDDGRTLYVTASTSLYRIRTTTRDAVSRRRATI
ncbi:SMP-30/gluconolactonase/LRE family protein [Brachybacterium sp. J153]|uniref:SMP-30/gluconolactonase/LRE family protein n=1 Tax=Brachybacterium sp. J153 TaxID=3116488 RepID=UPI002E796D80|nr:SMP-30/gluconolactonase/LRE family protein [Brachybacterium sp. J153]MEE1617216.1 SMP-30/gluconolactonase/LRE family protein [Brachybacterium sp. J153]